MSIRSSTTSPPRSRSFSCRQISSAASRFVRTALVSASPAERLLPLLTSTATSASVSSITRRPPEERGTSRECIRSICSSTPNAWKSGAFRSYSSSFACARGETIFMKFAARFSAAG